MHGRLMLAAAAAAAALSLPATAGAATAIGPALDGGAPAPPAATCAATASCTAVGRGAVSPVDGVVVRWRVRSASAGAVRLRIVRPATPAGSWRSVATGPEQALTGDGDAVQELDARLPIAAGDVLALDGLPAAFRAGGTGAQLVGHDGWPDGEVRAGGAGVGELLVGAVVEPDADHDGKGDETQDEVADVAVTGSAPAEVDATTPIEHAFTVRNLGPDATPGVTLTASAGRSFAGPGCDGTPTCALGLLAAGASVTVRVTWAEPAIFPPPPGTFASTVTAGSATVDPVASNDAATVSTVRLPWTGTPSLPPAPVPDTPCRNRLAGTGDDELLRGTGFGDRILGLDGSDRILGGGGDDCLEGGSGPDVLDGQAGHDRLDGGLGRDSLIGGTGDDRLTAGMDDDRLSGGAGKDQLLPGRGRDRVSGGPGDDAVSTRDGTRDVIDCGSGRDAARVDRKDRVAGCERVARG